MKIIYLLFFLFLFYGCLTDVKTDDKDYHVEYSIQLNNFTPATVYYWTKANSKKTELGPNSQGRRFDYEYWVSPGIVLEETLYLKKENNTKEYDASINYNVSYKSTDGKLVKKEIIFTWDGTSLK